MARRILFLSTLLVLSARAALGADAHAVQPSALIRGHIVVSPGQSFHLVSPASVGYQPERHGFIKIAAAFEEGDSAAYRGQPIFPVTIAAFSEQEASVGFPSAFGEQRTNRHRTAAAQYLARNSCIAFADTSSSSNLPKSCDAAFQRYWDESRLPGIVVCGAEWVPKGGHRGDTYNDPLLPFRYFSDSVVFEVPPSAQRRAAAASTKDALRVCYYPMPRRIPGVVPVDTGGLQFIEAPLLTPAIPILERTPVRIFIDPGWELSAAVRTSSCLFRGDKYGQGESIWIRQPRFCL